MDIKIQTFPLNRHIIKSSGYITLTFSLFVEASYTYSV